jgi:hypothetical protein
MRRPRWLAAFFLFLAATLALAATQEAGEPDREMLRMMEFLREIEMLKRMEMIRELRDVEQAGGQLPSPRPAKSPPLKKKEPVK